MSQITKPDAGGGMVGSPARQTFRQMTVVLDVPSHHFASDLEAERFLRKALEPIGWVVMGAILVPRNCQPDASGGIYPVNAEGEKELAAREAELEKRARETPPATTVVRAVEPDQRGGRGSPLRLRKGGRDGTPKPAT